VGNLGKTVRESKPPEIFCNYLAMVSSIIESEPSTFEEAAGLEGCHGGRVQSHHEE
jgi:hypothetical protein